MEKEVEKAVDDFNAKAKRVFKLSAKMKFQEIPKELNALKSVALAAMLLPEANCAVDDDYVDYPPVYDSAYLKAVRPDEIVMQLSEVAGDFNCDCPKVKCVCNPAPESIITVNGISCGYCKDSLPRGSQAGYLEKKKKTICRVCRRILYEKAYPEYSLQQAINDLIADASSEAVYYQFRKSIELVDEANKRLAEFLKI